MIEKRPVAQTVAPQRQPASLCIPQREGEGAETAGNAGVAPAFEHAQDELAILRAGQLLERKSQRSAKLFAIVQTRERDEQRPPVAAGHGLWLANLARDGGALREQRAFDSVGNGAAAATSDCPEKLLFSSPIDGRAVEHRDAGEGAHLSAFGHAARADLRWPVRPYQLWL
jgi:hypothetical protein